METKAIDSEFNGEKVRITKEMCAACRLNGPKWSTQLHFEQRETKKTIEIDNLRKMRNNCHSTIRRKRIKPAASRSTSHWKKSFVRCKDESRLDIFDHFRCVIRELIPYLSSYSNCFITEFAGR